MKSITNCPFCSARLRIPSIGQGTIKCPHCQARLDVSSGKINNEFGDIIFEEVPIANTEKNVNKPFQADYQTITPAKSNTSFIEVGTIIVMVVIVGLCLFGAWEWLNQKYNDSPRQVAEASQTTQNPTQNSGQTVYHPNNLHVPKNAPRLTEPFSISGTDESGNTKTHTYDSQTGTLYESTVFRNYQGKFTEGSDGELYIDNFTLNVSKTRINYTKNGETKYWDVRDMGDVYHTDEGFEFKFRKLYLPTPNTYVYVSYDKMVKYAGVFYYVVIIDGVRQYAL